MIDGAQREIGGSQRGRENMYLRTRSYISHLSYAIFHTAILGVACGIMPNAYRLSLEKKIYSLETSQYRFTQTLFFPNLVYNTELGRAPTLPRLLAWDQGPDGAGV